MNHWFQLQAQHLKYEDEILQRKARSDAWSEEKCQRVREFLLANSTVVANVKCVKKGLRERRILNDSLRNLRKKYNETTTEPVGLTTFAEQRGDMLLQDQGKFLQCLCEVCENFKLMLDGLKKYCLKNKVQLEFDMTIHDLLAHMMCAADDLLCALGKCAVCGIVNFDMLESKKAEKVAYTFWGKDDHNRKTVMNVEETVEDNK